MLGLVLGNKYFPDVYFLGTGWCFFFLLIGFYYQKPSAVRASKKAFIVTRFADLGFLIGILILSFNTKTFDFISLTNPTGSAISQGAGIGFLGLSIMTWSMIFVFMGGVGKSAMFPFHIWLPDAMEGPTPVSALNPCCNNGCSRCLPGCKNVPNICHCRTCGSECCCICRGIFFTLCSSYCLYTD